MKGYLTQTNTTTVLYCTIFTGYLHNVSHRKNNATLMCSKKENHFKKLKQFNNGETKQYVL